MSKISERRPGFYFFSADWRSDPCLSACSEGARYLWFEMLLVMNECAPRGYLLLNGKSPDVGTIACITRTDPSEVERRLSELADKGVYSRTRAGVIYSRKMVRDEKKARISRENGKKGGNPTLRKQSENPPWDNPKVNHQDKPLPYLTLPKGRERKERDSLTGVEKESCASASPTLPTKQPTTRGSRLPEGWKLSDDDRDYARSRGLSFEATRAMALDFEQYWRAKAGKDAVKCDWRATWQRWVRNSENYKRSGGASNLKEERLYEERKAKEWIIEQAFKSGVVPMAVESDGNDTDSIQRDDGDIKGEVVPIRGSPFRRRGFS